MTPLEAQEIAKYPLTKEIEIEAAMCAWEYVLKRPECDEYGSGHMRDCCAYLAPSIHEAWGRVNQKEASFDYDFVPWFIDNCVLFQPNHNMPMLTHDWIQRCRDFNRKDTAEILLKECQPYIKQRPDLVARIRSFTAT